MWDLDITRVNTTSLFILTQYSRPYAAGGPTEHSAGRQWLPQVGHVRRMARAEVVTELEQLSMSRLVLREHCTSRPRGAATVNTGAIET